MSGFWKNKEKWWKDTNAFFGLRKKVRKKERGKKESDKKVNQLCVWFSLRERGEKEKWSVGFTLPNLFGQI